MADALIAALETCETLLEKERREGASEDLVRAKEAAVARLEEALAAGQALGADPEALALRLRGLLEGNRFSLRWSNLRVQLARIGQPKPGMARREGPHIDLVH